VSTTLVFMLQLMNYHVFRSYFLHNLYSQMWIKKQN